MWGRLCLVVTLEAECTLDQALLILGQGVHAHGISLGTRLTPLIRAACLIVNDAPTPLTTYFLFCPLHTTTLLTVWGALPSCNNSIIVITRRTLRLAVLHQQWGPQPHAVYVRTTYKAHSHTGEWTLRYPLGQVQVAAAIRVHLDKRILHGRFPGSLSSAGILQHLGVRE